MSGKGSDRRPGESYEEAHERIFGERKRTPYTPPPLPQPKEKK